MLRKNCLSVRPATSGRNITRLAQISVSLLIVLLVLYFVLIISQFGFSCHRDGAGNELIQNFSLFVSTPQLIKGIASFCTFIRRTHTTRQISPNASLPDPKPLPALDLKTLKPFVRSGIGKFSEVLSTRSPNINETNARETNNTAQRNTFLRGNWRQDKGNMLGCYQSSRSFHYQRDKMDMAGISSLPWSWACTACAGSNVTLPHIAACIAGNARTFSDPRVYESIKHNLLQALGANITVFLYLKTFDDVKSPQFLGFQPLENVRYNPKRVYDAISSLKSSYKVVAKLVKERIHVPLNNGCAWMRGNPTIESNVGQLHSNEQCHKMVEEYETEHSVTFTHFLKTRPDGAWPQSAPAWCTLLPNAAYLSHPQPPDWFILLPRAVARKVFKLYTSYAMCQGDALKQEPDIGFGGGITALIVGEIRRAGIPLFGPPVPGLPPPSREVPHMFSQVLMRVGSKIQWCHTGAFIEESRFPDPSTCERVLRYREIE